VTRAEKEIRKAKIIKSRGREKENMKERRKVTRIEKER
jgi:hypothetical protein